MVEPTVDVVGPFEVDQGLMLIDMDYGWMRAAEACAELDETARGRAMACSDRAITARERAWYLEERLWSGEAPAGALARLREVKREVEDAVAERASLGLPTPPEAEGWWRGWEPHANPRPAHLAAAP